MKRFIGAALLAVILCVPGALAQTTPSPETPTAATPVPTPAPTAPSETSSTSATDPAAEEAHRRAEAQAFFDSLQKQTGVIALAGGKVQLNVPADAYYYLSPQESRRVLVDLWGNPPSAAENIEGMLFPHDGNPADGSWGAVLEYSADGYVSDFDASTANYDELLHTMQEQAQNSNEQRQQAGFPRVSLVGWAERPHYEAATHKIYWGRQLHFDGVDDVDTLNYDIRILGREGYLVVSFVSVMPELESIRQSTPSVLAMADFTQGNRYADYREGIDQRAAYGIGGLIAGGAALAVVQKTGILALLLAFGKKFIVLIGVGLVAAGNFFRRLFGRKKDDEPPTT